MNETKAYLENLSMKLENVCKTVLPGAVRVPRFADREFDDLDQTLSGILLDFSIMEEDARKENVRYAVMLAIIKSTFVSDFYITSHMNDATDGLAKLLTAITVDDMLEEVC